MLLQIILLFLGTECEKIPENVCMAGDRSCMTVKLNDLDDVKTKISWVDYMSDTPVVRREMPIAAKFRNFRDELVYQYYDNRKGGVYLGQIAAGGGFGGSNTYTTHVFYFVTKAGEEVARFTMKAGQLLYIIEP